MPPRRVVDFALSEGAFLTRAKQQGWTPEKIAGAITVRSRAMFGDQRTVVEVRDSYFKEAEPKGEGELGSQPSGAPQADRR